eukprot:gene11749-5087_t
MKIMEEVSGKKYPDQVIVYEDGTLASAYTVDIIPGKYDEITKNSPEDLKQLDESIINSAMSSTHLESSVFMYDPKTDKLLDPDDEAILNEEKPISFNEPKFNEIFGQFLIKEKEGEKKNGDNSDELFDESFGKVGLTTTKPEYNTTSWRDDLLF